MMTWCKNALRIGWESEMAIPANDTGRLKVYGVFRQADNLTAIGVTFSRRLTDEELRFFHEVCERSAPLMDGVK